MGKLFIAYVTFCRFVFLDLVLYGWAIIPFVYIFSFLFQVASTGYVWTTVLNIFTGKQSLNYVQCK